MANSGYIDWHRLDRTQPWTAYRDGWNSYVIAFWTVDYGRAVKDQGVSVFKNEGQHPDWFLHANTADHVLAAYPHPHSHVSPNFKHIFDNNMSARPLLASVTLGTVNACYRTTSSMWWASIDDLTRRGKQLIKNLNRLYERQATVVTFVEAPTDEASGSRSQRIN